MTEQFQEESINGQPSPLSLIATPAAPAAPGLVDTEAIFWASLAADAAIVGNGIEVAGDANVGSIIQFTQPGLFEIQLVTATTAPAPPFAINLLRGVTVPITGGNGYPALDFVTGALGAIDLGFFGALAPEGLVKLTSTFRIRNIDLADPIVGVNPDRQIRFSMAGPTILDLFPPSTRLEISRVSR